MCKHAFRKYDRYGVNLNLTNSIPEQVLNENNKMFEHKISPKEVRLRTKYYEDQLKSIYYKTQEMKKLKSQTYVDRIKASILAKENVYK